MLPKENHLKERIAKKKEETQVESQALLFTFIMIIAIRRH